MVQQFYLLLLLLNVGFSLCSLKILMFGDSVDRLIVAEWCSLLNIKTSQWGDYSIRYGDGRTKQPSMMCENPKTGDSIAALHIFGSKPFGPYLWVETERDKFAKTVPRIQKAIELYINQFDMPTIVFYNSILWDLRIFYVNGGLNETSPDFNSTLDTWNYDVNERIDDFFKIFEGTNVKIGLRTSPYYNDNNVGFLMTQYNILMRNIAKNRNLTLYDFDLDVWSTGFVNYNYDFHDMLFRDSCHPKRIFMIRAAEKLLGYRYTSYYNYFNNHITIQNSTSLCQYNVYRNQDHLDLQDCANFSIELVQSSQYDTASESTLNEVFFLSNLNDTLYRWNKVTSMFLLKTCFSPGDILSVHNNSIDALPYGPEESVPYEIFNNANITIVTSNQSFFLVQNNVVRSTNNKNTFAFFLKLYENMPTISNVSYFWVNFLSEPWDDHLPDIFDDNTLLRLHDEKQVYVVLNQTRHAIPSISVFTSHGYDFENVKVLTHKHVLELLPLGDDLT